MLLISFSVWVGYWLSRRFVVRRAAVRVALGMLVGGLLAYNYLVLGLPGGRLSPGAPADDVTILVCKIDA